MTDPILDLAGIGIGPFNLSLAAQLDGLPDMNARFFEQRPAFSWHPGMMLPGAELQTSCLKDLVTATNPTSPWSFMAYLVAHKRFYDFMNAEFDALPRQEFANYLAWAANGIESLRFGKPVRALDFSQGQFVLGFDDGEVAARNVCLGIGLVPDLPAFAMPLAGDTCFHASAATARLTLLNAGRVAVVGGGQSGAEVFLSLLSQVGTASEVSWISRRPNFEPLDATPFTNELFTPGYVTDFHGIGEDARNASLARQKLASDGASASTLKAIYQRLYALRHLGEGALNPTLMPGREVIQMERQRGEYRLVMRNGFDGGIEIVHADAVVLATGYGFRVPEFLAPLRDRIAFDRKGLFQVNPDFSLTWDGPRQNRIFALNASRHSHGIAEPQLSLMAWRSSVVANALSGRPHFDLDLPEPVVSWTSTGAPRQRASGLPRTADA
ncbi:lysine/ornithine N-monooxygenase [Azorhizobium sp. AG788]|uniref:lysine N(6)-hydroxylase/L-ornithine N(5)-oxygenase family protein n=1 Tax=Azorhizobium sp. AG788 TaxID=2183897 RepID=UPI00105CF1A9|nr:SidA/IucD/PvdA family monooxygenase [Azorhizobium sp. AG788]TDT93702.1 lysine/ornithine N-monooxygenase [Azorhizobium sp. AG788]